MRVWRPALIAGHASACAGVGAAKFSANQFATAGWNSVRMAAGSREAAWRRREVVRAAVVEARSVSKRLGSPGDAQEWRPASYIGRRGELWRPRRARLPNAATWARLGASEKPGKAEMTSATQPTVALNDGASMPQFGLGVFQTPPDATEQVVKLAVDRRLSPGRHRGDVSKRGRRRPSLARSDGCLRDHETRQFGSRLRRNDARVRRERQKAPPRHDRSLPDPLAAPAREPLRRKLEGARPSAEGRARSLDRRLELQPRSPRTGDRRNGRDAFGEPDRAASAVPAARLARVSR